MNKKLLQIGFTLLEVMVVIAIIGILSAVVVVNYASVKEAARDDIRKADLKSLQLALKLYKAQNGVYPDAGCGEATYWTGPGTHSNGFGGNLTDCPEYIVGLVPEFIGELPTDPNKESEIDKGYIYHVNGTHDAYKVLVNGSVETKFVTSFENEFARCPKNYSNGWCGAVPDPSVYAIYSAGAEDW
ncbi:prepilin-type N-terminal cleavage/methylation domain-containing protein [Candidatus Nomurabacteria bacterium]|nr:prepilin-type N-terminal cleavage/methylation domain-containing protein [Candidatus Kaiserbacteria bacterium]MCB9814201.1 prepilin-type N-terminal cleavage/methylation domain-containing protein [Candidatus Nomurabacteria bacterium]